MTAHVYLSPACLHETHRACDVECWFCLAMCSCPCHATDERFLRAKQAAEQREEDRQTEAVETIRSKTGDAPT